MRMRRAFFTTMAIQTLQALLSILTGALVARLLGPAGQGVYAVVLAGVALTATIAVLGQFQGIASVAAEGRYPASTLTAAALLHSALVLLLAAASSPAWAPLLPSRGAFAIVAICLILSHEVFALMLRGIALGRHDIAVYSGSMLAQRVGFFAGVLVLSITGAAELRSVMAVWLISLTLSLAPASIWLLRRNGGVAGSRTDIGAAWARVLGRGGRAFVVLTVTLILIRFDVWTLGAYLTVEAVGQMSVALTLAEWLWYVPTILANLLFAMVAADTGVRSVERVARASRAVATCSLLAAPVLVLLGPALLVQLYGDAYAQAGVIFALLVPGMVAIAIHLIIDSYFAGSGFPPFTLWAAAGALLAKLGLNLLLVPPYGLAGAALATSAVYIGLLVAKTARFTQIARISARDLLLANGSDVQYAAHLFRESLGTLRRGVPRSTSSGPVPGLATSARALESEQLK